jgi:hypothetical protein
VKKKASFWVAGFTTTHSGLQKGHCRAAMAQGLGFGIFSTTVKDSIRWRLKPMPKADLDFTGNL